jgi:hypothetical protein
MGRFSISPLVQSCARLRVPLLIAIVVSLTSLAPAANAATFAVNSTAGFGATVTISGLTVADESPANGGTYNLGALTAGGDNADTTFSVVYQAQEWREVGA